MHQQADEARRGQDAAIGRAAHAIDAVAVFGRQEAIEGHLGSAPAWTPFIVAGAVVGAIPFGCRHAGRRIPYRAKPLQRGATQRDLVRMRLPGQLIDVLEAARSEGSQLFIRCILNPISIATPFASSSLSWIEEMTTTWLRSSFGFECCPQPTAASIYKTLVEPRRGFVES